MRISDWSSDVCSSELRRRLHHGRVGITATHRVSALARSWPHRARISLQSWLSILPTATPSRRTGAGDAVWLEGAGDRGVDVAVADSAADAARVGAGAARSEERRLGKEVVGTV